MKVEKKERVEPAKTATGKISVTPTAGEWILRLLQAEALSPETHGLRVSVRGGGCSGFTYEMAFDTPGPEDSIFERDGARAIVDPQSLAYLNGSTLTYLARLQGAGFMIVNPNITGSCGCGHSFSV